MVYVIADAGNSIMCSHKFPHLMRQSPVFDTATHRNLRMSCSIIPVNFIGSAAERILFFLSFIYSAAIKPQ